MLGKLMKYEMKSTYKMGCLVLCAMAVITFLGWLAFQNSVWSEIGRTGGRSAVDWADFFYLFVMMLYAMLLVVANFGILIYLGVHFYRSMYTDQGYLTHTLPVSKHQILVSKMLVSGLWMLFVMIAIYLSLTVLGLSLVFSLLPDGYTLSQAWAEFTGGLWQLVIEFGEWFEFDVSGWLISTLLISLVTPFVTITTLFGAISIGQLASRYRLFLGVVCYIGILVVSSLVSSLFRSFATSLGTYMSSSLNIQFAVNLLVAAALYITSYFIISRKLNMG